MRPTTLAFGPSLRLLVSWASIGVFCCCSPVAGQERGEWPKREAVEKYDAYIRDTDARVEREVRSSDYLWASQSAGRLARVRQGEAVVEAWGERGDKDIGDAIIHDYLGALFIPGVTLAQVSSFLQDYNAHKNHYRPEVVDSRLISHDGAEWRLFYRLVKKKILTITLDTEHTATYASVGATRMHSRSHTTRIAEVKDAGKPSERHVPPGKDHGFLWRLTTYWRLEEKDGGVYIECQTISLTRAVPLGLGWLINPIIRSLPRESLARLLTDTRAGVLARGAAAGARQAR